MSSSEKKILEIHSAFMLEYTQARTELSEFYESVESFFLRITPENDDNERNLEKNIHTIQDICFFLKSFCSETALHVQLLKDAHNDDKIPNLIEDQSEVSDLEYNPPENPNKIYPFELYPKIFTYDAIDPSKFMQGLEAEFFVSFIKDSTNLLFFMIDASCRKIVFKEPEFRYDCIPDKGIVFGLLLDGEIVRVVRENCLKKRPISFKVLLIDFGEILEVTKDFKMYRLPEEIQKIPAQAIFCKLFLDENAEDCDYSNCLENKLNNKQKIRIERVYKNMLEVTFLPLINLNLLPSLNTSLAPYSSNCESLSDDTMSKSRNHTHTVNTSPANSVSAFQPKPSNPFIDMINGDNTLTKEDIEVLYEEPLNTENALEAVMGYVPQDEKRICKFFDPKTNACFKGANCTLEHTTILKDGWTKDKLISKFKIHSQVAVPKVGKKMNIFVSYIVDVERFYGQIIPKNCKSIEDLTADKILEKMNNPQIVSKYKKFERPPDELELIFALFTDNVWYRAKIIKKHSNTEFRVFYVDYGNCYNITLDQIRKWEDEFDGYPFQALEFRLDNVTKLKDFHTEAVAYFEQLAFQKSVVATVTCNIDILCVTLHDHEKFDIGEQLCAAEYAKSKPITQGANGQFPG